MTVAYLDAEWIVGDVSDAPALTVEPEGKLAFRGRAAAAPGGADSDTAALLAFAALAAEAVDLLEGAQPVEVTGRGIVAELVRASIGDRTQAGEPPQAIVDTTGDPEVIGEATRRLADLGLLVLAGEALGRRADLDVYPDVHVRGLRIVGARPLLSQPLAAEAPPVLVALRDVSADAPWHRIER